jgi:hypothetical protein
MKHPTKLIAPARQTRCLLITMMCSGLTVLRQPKRRILRTGQVRVLVAFLPLFVADKEIMTPKAFPAKAAFVMTHPKCKWLDPLREVMPVKL